MDNHYHLLLESPSGNLSQIMHHINGAYTTYFNVKRNRAGPLFQGRYKAILVQIDEYAKELSRYIHLNPVRAKMVNLPEDHQWSSYSSFIGKKSFPEWLTRDFLLAHFGKNVSTAQKGYQRFVESLLDQEYESPLNEVAGSALLGTPDFIKYIKDKYLSGMESVQNVPALKELSSRIELDQIFTEVDALFNNVPKVARNVKMYLGCRYSGKTLKDIGQHFGIGESGVSQASRRIADKIDKDKKLKKRIEKIEKKLNLSIMKTRPR
jgi:hypothetical protein